MNVRILILLVLIGAAVLSALFIVYVPATNPSAPHAAAANTEPPSRIEVAASQFSAPEFEKAIKTLEAVVKKKDWTEARRVFYTLRGQLIPVLNSSRRDEPAVVAFRRRLDAVEIAIDANYARERAAQEAAAKEAKTFQATALYAAFEANEVRANQALKGKEIRVRGTIERIGTDILNSPYVALDAGERFLFGVQQCFRAVRSPGSRRLTSETD
jgi:hypothetical protein